MKTESIESLVDAGDKNIDFQELYLFLNQKLKELYEKERITPLFDYADIRYSAMIDLLYEIMPSLKKDL